MNRPAAVVGNDTAGLTAAGPVILTAPPGGGPATVIVVPGFTATAVADHVYGTLTGRPAVVRADGTPAGLPDGTLTPTGTGGQFLPVVSQGRLYALHARGPAMNPTTHSCCDAVSAFATAVGSSNETQSHQPI